jgi:putative methyltransferase
MSELYKEAANLLQKLEKRQGGLKSLAYSENVVHKRSSFALVCETLRYKPLLKELLEAVPQFKIQKKFKDNMSLLYISLYDLLFGKQQKIQGGGFIKKELMKFANAFKEALVRKKIKAKVSTNEDLLPFENRQQQIQLPRYVRINTLLCKEEERDHFIQEYQAKLDSDVKDLLVLPPGTELHEHILVQQGKLILQDKASCFPAYILHGEHTDVEGGDTIDACAAPGNKTSHLAMLFGQKKNTYKDCKVFAFDRSSKRLDLLKRRMKNAGADKIVEACLQSFLEVDPFNPKYQNVKSILLDPSCSGSGMNNRLDHLLDIASSSGTVTKKKIEEEEEKEEEEYQEEETVNRLQSLADFQLEALLKAFSFSQVERIVYSTCSIFQKENEDVVAAALNSSMNQNQPIGRRFVLKKCLSTWSRRGLDTTKILTKEQANCLVRANGLEDQTNGFFVAYFERTNSTINQEMNKRQLVSCIVDTSSTTNKRKNEKSDQQKKKNRKRRKKDTKRKAKNASKQCVVPTIK